MTHPLSHVTLDGSGAPIWHCDRDWVMRPLRPMSADEFARRAAGHAATLPWTANADEAVAHAAERGLLLTRVGA